MPVLKLSLKSKSNPLPQESCIDGAKNFTTKLNRMMLLKLQLPTVA